MQLFKFQKLISTEKHPPLSPSPRSAPVNEVTSKSAYIHIIQPDQMNMAVFFWSIVKSDASLRYSTVAVT